VLPWEGGNVETPTEVRLQALRKHQFQKLSGGELGRTKPGPGSAWVMDGAVLTGFHRHCAERQGQPSCAAVRDVARSLAGAAGRAVTPTRTGTLAARVELAVRKLWARGAGGVALGDGSKPSPGPYPAQSLCKGSNVPQVQYIPTFRLTCRRFPHFRCWFQVSFTFTGGKCAQERWELENFKV